MFISAVTGVANTLLDQAGLRRSVHGIEQCGSVLFSQLYEALMGARPPRPRGGCGSEAERCQAVVEALSEQLSPHVSLDHIRGGDLAAREPLTIINLLDIFSGSRHFEILHCSLSALCMIFNTYEYAYCVFNTCSVLQFCFICLWRRVVPNQPTLTEMMTTSYLSKVAM